MATATYPSAAVAPTRIQRQDVLAANLAGRFDDCRDYDTYQRLCAEAERHVLPMWLRGRVEQAQEACALRFWGVIR